jgi:hypothetical protein
MSGKRHKKLERPSRRGGTASAPRANLPVVESLDTLLAQRFHGAANISGIRFQIRYSVLKCAQLGAMLRQGHPQDATLRFEGLEDLDSLSRADHPGLKIVGGDELIQVKSSQEGWGWAKLAAPVRSFLEAQRFDPGLRFRLVINFEPREDLGRLLRFKQLGAQERSALGRLFRQLVRGQGGTANEADRLLVNLELESVPEENLRRDLFAALFEASKTADAGALETLEYILAGKALGWAADRKSIGAADVLEVVRTSVEGLQHAERYEAFECRWVGPADYSRDAAPTDFFDGKRARLGHVAANLDVRRPRWLAEIGTAFEKVPVCVIRAPSGHGKSTLAYRYALENWPARQTVEVRSAATAEQVAAVAAYFRFRRELGAPVWVLIDAGPETSRWPEVAQAAAATGARVLVTVRVEDWLRFELGALTVRRVIEPSLDLQEAREIFSAFRARGQVHPSVRSAGEAFERLRPPHLLLEYVHLLTHGQMLEDRLRDQLRMFAQLGEDPAKKQLLRLVSLANALGASVPLDSAIRSVSVRDDAQDVVGSLVGEYLALEDGKLKPLHWVRSDHLSRILHEGGIPPIMETVDKVVDLAAHEDLRSLVANAFRRRDVDRESLLDLLVGRFGGAETEVVLSIVDGLFEAGERDYYSSNRSLVEEAFDVLGSNGVWLLAADTAPGRRVNVLKRMAEISKDRAGANANRLLELLDHFQPVARGVDWVKRFLEASAARLEPSAAESATGCLLDWCAVVGVRLERWTTILPKLVSDSALFARGVDAVCDFSQGLFRYDRSAHGLWFDGVKGDLLPYLQLQTECLTLELRPFDPSATGTDPYIEDPEDTRQDIADDGIPDKELAVTYLVEQGSGVSPNDQSVRRLQTLRRALPFVSLFQASGVQPMLGGLVPSIDSTQKAMPRRNLPLPSDVSRNTISMQVVLLDFGVGTYYQVQEAWSNLRRTGLAFLEVAADLIDQTLEARSKGASRLVGPTERAAQELDEASRIAPPLAARDLETLGPIPQELRSAADKRGPAEWERCLTSFRRWFADYWNDRDERSGKAALLLLHETHDHLGELHSFFRAFFLHQPDHFRVLELEEEEQRALSRLDLLLEGWIVEPPPVGPGQAVERIKARRKGRNQKEMERVRQALMQLDPMGDRFAYPSGVLASATWRSLPLGVPVRDPLEPAADLLEVCAALAPVADLADEFWLFPLWNGSWVGRGAHRISARLFLKEVESDRDKSLAALALLFPSEPPDGLTALLPPLLRTDPPEPDFRQKAAGLASATELYLQQRNGIARVPGPTRHPYQVELENRLRRQLRPIEDEIANVARELTGRLDSMPRSADEDALAARRELRDWLAAIQMAVGSEFVLPDSPARLTAEKVTTYAALAKRRS